MMSEKQVASTRGGLLLTVAAVYLSWFLVALDRLIVATATPAITDEFHSISDVAWYGTAYLLTSSVFLLAYGKAYALFHIKSTYMGAIVLFMAGSFICGAASNSAMFIIGRAIAGFGSAGLSTGTQTILVSILPLSSIPRYMGVLGAVYGVASIGGPVVGGALTTHVSWRWCFYINLPIGAFALVALWFFFQEPPVPRKKQGLRAKIQHLDIWGNVVFMPGVVCLVLALQWGGTSYAWNSGIIVALLETSCILLASFVVIQIWKPETATVAPKLFKQRSILAGFLASLFTGASMTVLIYYIPIWYQAIQGGTAGASGTFVLPLVISLVIATTISGFIIDKIGYYMAVMTFGVICSAIGSGMLITAVEIEIERAKWIGYQALLGFGFGFMAQPPMVAARVVLSRADVSVGLALMRFSTNLGGVLSLPIGATILTNTMSSRLAVALPDFDTSSLTTQGLTTITDLPPSEKAEVLRAYNISIQAVFALGAAMACLVAVGPLGMEWVNLKDKKAEEKEKMLQQKRINETVDDTTHGEV